VSCGGRASQRLRARWLLPQAPDRNIIRFASSNDRTIYSIEKFVGSDTKELLFEPLSPIDLRCRQQPYSLLVAPDRSPSSLHQSTAATSSAARTPGDWASAGDPLTSGSHTATRSLIRISTHHSPVCSQQNLADHLHCLDRLATKTKRNSRCLSAGR